MEFDPRARKSDDFRAHNDQTESHNRDYIQAKVAESKRPIILTAITFIAFVIMTSIYYNTQNIKEPNRELESVLERTQEALKKATDKNDQLTKKMENDLKPKLDAFDEICEANPKISRLCKNYNNSNKKWFSNE